MTTVQAPAGLLIGFTLDDLQRMVPAEIKLGSTLLTISTNGKELLLAAEYLMTKGDCPTDRTSTQVLNMLGDWEYIDDYETFDENPADPNISARVILDRIELYEIRTDNRQS